MQPPASPPTHDPNSTNRRCLPRRNPKRRLVWTSPRRLVSANLAGACHHASNPRSALHFRAASALASLERAGAPHLVNASLAPLGSRKRLGRARNPLERTSRPLEPKPRPPRRAASQFFRRGFGQAGSRPRLSVRSFV